MPHLLRHLRLYPLHSLVSNTIQILVKVHLGCSLLKEGKFENVGTLSKPSCKEFAKLQDYWWRIFTSSPHFCQRIKREFAHRLVTDGVSVGVATFRSKQDDSKEDTTSIPAKSAKRKRTASRSIAWVQGVPASTPLIAERILGLDPGRNSLFTAVIHEERATNNLQASQPIQHRVLSWSQSRWQEVSGIKHSKLKRELWSRYDPILRDSLLATPTPKVASTAAFGNHISHRLMHLPAATRSL